MLEDFDKLKQDIEIRANIIRKESSGWHSCICPICHGGSKGRVTGGFLLEEDSIGYQCFRASCDSNTGLERGGFVSRKFKDLMNAIGVDIPVSILLAKNNRKIPSIEELDHRYKEHGYHSIDDLPSHEKLLSCESDKAIEWKDSLSNRRIDLNRIWFFTDGKYKNLPFIKFMYYGKLIGYQVITRKKYITETGGNRNIIYLPNGKVPNICYIVEGAVDALMYPDYMVSILGSQFTKEHAYILRSASMRIFIPDNEGYGHPFVNYAKMYDDWISILKNGKDINELVQKRGLILTAEEIRNQTTRDYNQAILKSKVNNRLAVIKNKLKR